MSTLPNPFIFFPNDRFKLNEQEFMNAIEPPPKFLREPSPEYLSATEISPILQLLAEFA